MLPGYWGEGEEVGMNPVLGRGELLPAGPVVV